jgi:hypothetical protein
MLVILPRVAQIPEISDRRETALRSCVNPQMPPIPYL